MTTLHTRDTDAIGGTRKIWLLLLLLVLVVVLVIYDQGAVKDYGEKAYTKATTWTEKASRWAKQLYQCGLPGCKSGKTTEAIAMAPLQATPPVTVVLPAESAPSGESPAIPAANNESPAWNTTATEAPAKTDQLSGGSINYPAYPAYPAYPPYSASGSSGNEKTLTPPPVSEAVAPPPTPPAPPKPAAPAAKAELPEYQAYPAYPSYPKSTSPAPSTMVTPQSPPEAPQQSTLPPPAAKPGYSKVLPYAASSESGNSLEPARKSALAGRLGESIHLYLQYLDTHPNDINAHGELGNVYMRIGLNSEAAQNYYEAATRMIDAGQTSAIASLLPIIEMHEPVLAKLLNKKLARASGDVRRQPR